MPAPAGGELAVECDRAGHRRVEIVLRADLPRPGPRLLPPRRRPSAATDGDALPELIRSL